MIALQRKYIQRLEDLDRTLAISTFFAHHEVFFNFMKIEK